MTDSISLHRFGVDPEYPNFRKNLLGERQVHRLRVRVERRVETSP